MNELQDLPHAPEVEIWARLVIESPHSVDAERLAAAERVIQRNADARREHMHSVKASIPAQHIEGVAL